MKLAIGYNARIKITKITHKGRFSKNPFERNLNILVIAPRMIKITGKMILQEVMKEARNPKN